MTTIDAFTINDSIPGRKKIWTDVKCIDASNVVSVLNDALTFHNMNATHIKFLMDYEKGVQPILERIKTIRPDINVKVLINNAAKITDFKIAYEFGSPITYIQRAKKQVPETDSDKDDIRVTALNEMLIEEFKTSKDVQLARDFKICGVGYRMIKAKPVVDGKSVFDILILNPQTTFVVYSNDIYQRPMMAVTYCKQYDGNTVYGCYTNDTYFEIDNGIRITNGVREENWQVMNGQGIQNIPSIIPIVEYVNDYDRMGCFEKVIPLIDSINIASSDCINDIAQHVQNLIWMNNCELEEGKTLSTNGVIQTKSAAGVQAAIQFLENKLDQTGTQATVGGLTRELMEISSVPNRQENSGGGSTGSAMNLSSGWQFAETAAVTSESIFEQPELQSIKIMLAIIKISTDIPEEYSDITKLSVSDVKIKFSRSKIYDLATKANAISALLKCGFNGLHVMKTIPLFTDDQAVWTDSKEMIEKIQKLLGEPKQTASNLSDSNTPHKTMQDMSDQPQKTPQSDI